MIEILDKNDFLYNRAYERVSETIKAHKANGIDISILERCLVQLEAMKQYNEKLKGVVQNGKQKEKKEK